MPKIFKKKLTLYNNLALVIIMKLGANMLLQLAISNEE